MMVSNSLNAIALTVLCASSLVGQTTLKVDVREAVESCLVEPTVGPTLYRARLVLPDGSHGKASCLSTSVNCGAIESFHPEQMKPDAKKCGFEKSEGLTFYTCTMLDLGQYNATREGNDLVIVVPFGTVRYHIDGSW
jgi:hypothetical protein